MPLELRVPPIVLVIVTATGMWVAAQMMGFLRVEMPGRPILGGACVGFGLLSIGLGVREFRQYRTTVDPRRPATTSALVDRGIYTLTRNPMYLGFALVLFAWGIVLANLASLALVAGFILYLTRFQIIPEERALQSKFGDAFSNYRARVRRWL